MLLTPHMPRAERQGKTKNVDGKGMLELFLDSIWRLLSQ
jgi:hypothetical protein